MWIRNTDYNTNKFQIEESLDFDAFDFGQLCCQDHLHGLSCFLEPIYTFQKINGFPQVVNLAIPRFNRVSTKYISKIRQIIIKIYTACEKFCLSSEFLVGSTKTRLGLLQPLPLDMLSFIFNSIEKASIF